MYHGLAVLSSDIVKAMGWWFGIEFGYGLVDGVDRLSNILCKSVG